MARCMWCREFLKWEKDKRGLFRWVHQNGQLYVTNKLRDKSGEEIEVDDHCALPIPEEGEELCR